MTPRCGRPMRRYETAFSGPVLEDPVCGRPKGHKGWCRSRRAVARYYKQDAQRITARRRQGLAA